MSMLPRLFRGSVAALALSLLSAATGPAQALDKVRVGVQGGYTTLLKRLAALLTTLVPGANVPTTVTRRMIGAVGLGTDPVTGT